MCAILILATSRRAGVNEDSSDNEERVVNSRATAEDSFVDDGDPPDDNAGVEIDEKEESGGVDLKDEDESVDDLTDHSDSCSDFVGTWPGTLGLVMFGHLVLEFNHLD